MSKKIAIFPIYLNWSIHFATDLELAEKHLKMGDTVTIYEPDPSHVWFDNGLASNGHLQRIWYSSKFRNGIKMLTQRGLQVKPLVNKSELINYPEFPKFVSVEELASYKVDGFDIGMAVLSSLVSRTRNPEPDLQEYNFIVQELLRESWIVYQAVKLRLYEENYDKVYLFNGRFATLRSVYRACQNRGVEMGIHERGNSVGYYEVYQNHLPHDREKFVLRARALWDQGDPDERVKISRAWFDQRRQGVEQAWKSFIREQEVGKLPENWDNTRRNLVIFTSSEDEFVAIGPEWKNPFYASQYEGLQKLISDLEANHIDCDVWIRLHPNMGDMDADYTNRYFDLKNKHVTIISPVDKVSTYALVDAADTVLTYGSSVGVEASYSGKPSILIGKSFYQGMGICHEPQSHSELITMLSGITKPIGADESLIYAYYFSRFGIPFEFFEPDGLFGRGTFMGSKIRSSLPILILCRLFKFLGHPIGHHNLTHKWSPSDADGHA